MKSLKNILLFITIVVAQQPFMHASQQMGTVAATQSSIMPQLQAGFWGVLSRAKAHLKINNRRYAALTAVTAVAGFGAYCLYHSPTVRNAFSRMQGAIDKNCQLKLSEELYDEVYVCESDDLEKKKNRITELIKADADVNWSGSTYTLLGMAARSKNAGAEGIVDFLLEIAKNKINVNQKNAITGRTALMDVIVDGTLAMVQKFVSMQGIDLGIQDKTGRTALHWAVIYAGNNPNNSMKVQHYTAVVKAILDAPGSDKIINIVENEERTALQRAQTHGLNEIITLLEKYR